MPVIASTWEVEVRGMWFEASPDKTLTVKKQAGCGGLCL
jgi:hypothetical protein